MQQLSITTIRMLAADMVEKAASGHPGLPLGAAPLIYRLYLHEMKHNPGNPGWPDRDRFILSAGHGSALLYAILHLTGYDLPLTELKNFRQWGSRTPGHPEYGLTPGVEATTGPLGQGFAIGVGLAMAERFLAGQFNRPGFSIVDHYTYALVSDGDLMEGVASEAASLAGALKLGKLIYLYDDNHISIEGDTDLTFTEDRMKRFEAYGWHTQTVSDPENLEAVGQAVQRARDAVDQPSIIAVRTHIGYGSPKQDTAAVHGEPLGQAAMSATRAFYNWPEETFHVPPKALAHCRQAVERGRKGEEEWSLIFKAYKSSYPELAARFEAQMEGRLPEGWLNGLPVFRPEEGKIATRAAGGKVINGLAKTIPNLIGGSADLAPSTKTWINGSGDLRNGEGRNIHFGVREHGMGAVVNGLALHGGIIPYGATFFVFADYMRPSLRLAALMDCRAVFVFTHDSIGVGEDGPTHQPVEHLLSLRAIPNLTVIRPADANETASAWKAALSATSGPTALILSRQNLPILNPEEHNIDEGVKRGAYVLKDGGVNPELIIMATGSEVWLALAAADKINEQGVSVRVVSIPSWELFSGQDVAYREKILPPGIKARLSVEAGVTLGWERFIGDEGAVIGLDRFGASAPGGAVMEQLGFSVDNVVARALALIKK